MSDEARDAARYQWIRQQALKGAPDEHGAHVWLLANWPLVKYRGRTFDEAIDRAMTTDFSEDTHVPWDSH